MMIALSISPAIFPKKFKKKKKCLILFPFLRRKKSNIQTASKP